MKNYKEFMNTGLSEKARQEISQELLKLLAENYATYLKTQNFHWNVRGEEFYALHLLFEKQYEAMSQEIDEIAERVRALGFYVDASFSSFKELASIPEEEKVLIAKDMLKHLVQAHESFIRSARKLVSLCEKEKDHGSIDLLGRLLIAHEKFAWMLR
ncbi:MAG: Dps family protein [Chlamydiales bacterium]